MHVEVILMMASSGSVTSGTPISPNRMSLVPAGGSIPRGSMNALAGSREGHAQATESSKDKVVQEWGLACVVLGYSVSPCHSTTRILRLVSRLGRTVAPRASSRRGMAGPTKLVMLSS